MVYSSAERSHSESQNLVRIERLTYADPRCNVDHSSLDGGQFAAKEAEVLHESYDLGRKGTYHFRWLNKSSPTDTRRLLIGWHTSIKPRES